MDSYHYSAEEIARRGRALYERDLHPAAEHEYDGRFLVEDGATGHESAADDLVAFDRTEKKNPEGLFYRMRVGRRAAHGLGRHLFSTGS